jgi:hypothetical protein
MTHPGIREVGQVERFAGERSKHVFNVLPDPSMLYYICNYRPAGSPRKHPEGGFPMKRTLLLVCAVLLVASLAFAGPPSTYQVTGPVLELKDDVIVVQKGKDKWEIARGKDTKVTGDLKVGSKVTIEYRMTAATVEVKDAKAKETKKK